MQVLGIAVDDALVARWAGWLAPAIQPFFVETLKSWPRSVTRDNLTLEQRDTYRTWKLGENLKVLWLDEATFLSMDRADRARLVRAQARLARGAVPSVRGWSDLLDASTLRAQADGHRFVWWPSLVATNAWPILRRHVNQDRLGSRHREVAPATWRRAAAVLPNARELAGTFAAGSGPNCFGTVMGVAGVAGSADQCVLQAPFEAWLANMTRRGGNDHEPGTVLVWREASGLPIHAAVTLGDGWIMEKPSRDWGSPRTVVNVSDLIRYNRLRGVRLERRAISPSGA